MSGLIFDGRELARQKEKELADKITKMGVILRMASVVFEEDGESLLYTRLKQEAAVRVGIQFSQTRVSLLDSKERVKEAVEIYCHRQDIVGVLIQKPEKEVWRRVTRAPKLGSGFSDWWRDVTRALHPKKDVDCLTEVNLQRVYAGQWRVLPATVQAVMEVLGQAAGERRVESQTGLNLTGVRAVVVGRSDIVGRPLAAVLSQSGAEVKLYGLDLNYDELRHSDIVVSATGVENLIRGEMIRPGAVVIDVGSKSGDVDLESVREVAGFVTPVPGGVGPITVVSLLENLVGMVGS